MVNGLERENKRTRNRKKENKNLGSGNFGNPKWREKICIRFLMLLTSTKFIQSRYRRLANDIFPGIELHFQAINLISIVVTWTLNGFQIGEDRCVLGK
jgi:hypothetical protein